jgi:hypothetical protein
MGVGVEKRKARPNVTIKGLFFYHFIHDRSSYICLF